MPNIIINRRALLKRRLALLALLMMRRQKRRWWVHPINLERRRQGDGENLVVELKNDEERFFNYTRLNLAQYNKLFSLVKYKLTRNNTFREPISPEIRLALTLRHLATGDSIPSLSYAFRIGKSTACTIIKETCDVLWETLSPEYVKFPSEAEWVHIAEDFNDQWDLPHCLGAIDGKHVVIQSPKKSGSQYYNYKKTFSIVLFGICDANYRFTYVDIGAYGSQSDGGVLRESVFGNKLFTGELNLPDDNLIPNTDLSFPYYFVGDEAFPLHLHLLRPYGGSNVGREKRLYNYRLTRARRCIENAFGILVARFRIYHRTINAHPVTVDSIIKATICLHNFILQENNCSSNKYCPSTFVDRYEKDGNMIPGDWRDNIPQNPALQNVRHLKRRLGARNATREAEGNREILKNYLNSPIGAVPWQDSII